MRKYTLEVEAGNEGYAAGAAAAFVSDCPHLLFSDAAKARRHAKTFTDYKGTRFLVWGSERHVKVKERPAK